MSNHKPHQTKIDDDIFYHLELILIDLERLELDFNREKAIVVACQNLKQKTLMVSRLYDRYDKPIFKAIKNMINSQIASEPNLKGILISVENSRCKSEKGFIKKLKISI